MDLYSSLSPETQAALAIVGLSTFGAIVRALFRVLGGRGKPNA